MVRGETETAGDDDILVIIDGDCRLPGGLNVRFIVQSSSRIGTVVTGKASARCIGWLGSTDLMRTVSIIVKP